uniref:Beta-lactamase fold-like protein n=1 Tax=uncultured organism TaxID=155900 RepID=M1PVG8_9ZZZZ|nr:beta-lactamase fold-like protein [uncultured organism]
MSAKSLWEKIRDEPVSGDHLAIWPLGGGSVGLKSGSKIGFVDPFLSNWSDDEWIRRFPPEVSPGKVENCSFVLITHEHEDHFDPETLTGLLEKNDFPIIAPQSVRSRLEGDPSTRRIEENLDTVISGEVRDISGLTVEIVETRDPLSELPLGFVLTVDSGSVGFMGDSLYDPDLVLPLCESHDLDAVFFAVGDNPPGEKYYLSIEELKVTAEELKPCLVVPIHWDLWTKTYINPLDFDLEEYDNVKIVRRGEVLKI